MSDVFISYKTEDRPRVTPLVEAFEAEGLSVWWDARVSGGEAWRETIAEQLDAARCVIVVWSKRSTGAEGRFVRDEASRAQQRGSYLPVTIDKVQPPLGFGEMQAMPLTGWKGDRSDPKYRAVRDCVHSILGRSAPTAAPGHTPQRTHVSRRAALAGGGAIAIAAAGAGGWLLLRSSGAKANTIAVMPFANLSGDPSDNYFSDGIAEEVRSALAAVGGIEVVARTSSEMLRNSDAITAAHRLSVANVVTGSVRRSPSTVRVSAQLVDGSSGLERWSQTFDRPIGDVLQIQSDIAANVAKELSVKLEGGSQEVLPIGGTNNPQAQDLLLQATATIGDDNGDAQLHRIALLQQATSLDPNYAEAFAALGQQQDLWANTYARNSAEKDRVAADATKALNRAVQIAPNLALAHSALGIIYYNQLTMKRALQESQLSVTLPGANAGDFVNHALTLSQLNRPTEAQSAINRAISLDPLNAVARSVQARIFYSARRYDESIEAGRRALLIRPANRLAKALIGWNLVLLGRMDEAARTFATMPADDYRRLVGEAAIAVRSGRKDQALGKIPELEKRYADAANYQVAEIYAQVGDTDKAIGALETAWTKRDSGLASMLGDPFLDPVRSDPRFRTIAARIFG
jgi:serine/threonine-protein kinase